MKTNKFFKFLTIMSMMVVGVMSLVSCSDDDDPKEVNIVGQWGYNDVYTDSDGTEHRVTMTLGFSSNRTGYIEETWQSESKASANSKYRMEFNWSTATDASGDEILKVSYVSGDKNTEIFNGNSNTVLWTREFVLTGNILNIYGNGGVWVFQRK